MIRRRVFRLLPCPNYCKWCLNEQQDACVFFNFGFLRVYAQEWDYWVVWWLYSQFFKKSPYRLPQWLYQFTFPPAMQEGSLFSTPSPAFIVCRLFDDGRSDHEVLAHCSFCLNFFNNQLDGITDSMNINLRKLWEMVKDRES